MSNVTPIDAKAPLELRRAESAREWATSEDRSLVFTVVRPNPEYVAPEDREPIEVGEGEIAPDYDVPAEVHIEYTMPSKPNPGLALAYLKRARENSDMAASWLLETALGSEGYDALVDELSVEPDPAVASATMQSIVQKVAQRALGGLSGKV